MRPTESTGLWHKGNSGYNAIGDERKDCSLEVPAAAVDDDAYETLNDLRKTPAPENRLAQVGAACADTLYSLIDTKEKSYRASVAISGITLSPLFFLSDTYFGKMIAGVDFWFNNAYMRNEVKDPTVDLTSIHKTMVDTTTFNMLVATFPLLLNLLPTDNNPGTYVAEVAASAAIVALNQQIYMLISEEAKVDADAVVEATPTAGPCVHLEQAINKRDTAAVSIVSTVGKLALLFYKMKHEAHSPSDECIQMTTALQGLWMFGRIVANLEKTVRPISSSGPAMLNGLVTMVVAQTFAVGLSALSGAPDGQASNTLYDLFKVLVASKIGGDIVHGSLKVMIEQFKKMAPVHVAPDVTPTTSARPEKLQQNDGIDSAYDGGDLMSHDHCHDHDHNYNDYAASV